MHAGNYTAHWHVAVCALTTAQWRQDLSVDMDTVVARSITQPRSESRTEEHAMVGAGKLRDASSKLVLHALVTKMAHQHPVLSALMAWTHC